MEAERDLNTFNFDKKVRPNENFFKYRNIFNNLVISQGVKTESALVSMAISFDSKVAIAITKSFEYEYQIEMFDLKTTEKVFEEKVGGDPDQYIKMKELAQNEVGDKYALVYFDDGKFRLRTFGRD